MVSLDFFLLTESFQPHYGPGVDSASNRNEYQECFLEVKAAGAYGWHPYHLRVPIVLKSGSLNLLEPSGPVQACNGIALPLQWLYLSTAITQSGRSQLPRGLRFFGLRPIACWDCVFETRRRMDVFLVSVVYWQVGVWSLVQRSPTECDRGTP